MVSFGTVRAQVYEFTSKCRITCSKCKLIPCFMQNVQGRECLCWPICWTDHTVTDLFCRGGRERSWKLKIAAHVVLSASLYPFSPVVQKSLSGEWGTEPLTQLIRLVQASSVVVEGLMLRSCVISLVERLQAVPWKIYFLSRKSFMEMIAFSREGANLWRASSAGPVFITAKSCDKTQAGCCACDSS